jgi:excisionase family DNA binding protein
MRREMLGELLVAKYTEPDLLGSLGAYLHRDEPAIAGVPVLITDEPMDRPRLEFEEAAERVTTRGGPEPAFYTIPEVAAILRIGRTTAYAMSQDGRLPVVRFGRSVRVPAKKLWERIDEITASASRR